MVEIVAFEKQRSRSVFRDGVRHAVAEIQRGPMTATASETRERAIRDSRVFASKFDDRNVLPRQNVRERQIGMAAWISTGDQQRFELGRGAEQAIVFRHEARE